MKCEICGTEANKGSLIFGVGFTCSEDCCQIAKGRLKAHHDELRAEPLGQMPDALDTADFERWALKLAIQIIAAMGKKDAAKIKRNNPTLLLPENMALELKDRILRHIPKCYISEVEARGHSRLFYGGTYCFRQPVPKDVIVESCRQAQVLQ